MATSGGSSSAAGGLAGAQSDPRDAANGGMDGGTDPADPEKPETDPDEEELVKKRWREYERARKFDENFRKQVAIDRRYAAGTSDLAWAVTTNLIGAFIDILVALLYARDPDVSVSKAPQVDDSGPGATQMEQFGLTLQIVISHLWRRGKLKKAARKGVRSVLSNAEGWFKATVIAEKVPKPEVEAPLNDARETVARLKAQQELLDDPNGAEDAATRDAQIQEKEALIADLEHKIELAINKMFVIDFIQTENIQVSCDIASIEDYLEADWIANEMYIDKEEALSRFDRLQPEDVKSAKQYFQRAPKELTTRDIDNVLPQGMLTAESAQAFTTSTSDPSNDSLCFYRAVELWDRRDKNIYTMLDGVKKWAKEPYQPPYPTSRFYPYFYFAFYEVDGQRHAQSLSWRLYKLQDEYSATRSNFRITRERSIPGVLFNATMLDDNEAKKLTESKHQEYTALRPADPGTPIGNLFAAKPVQGIDMRLYDPTLILNDMERISGVQEALSAAINGPGNPRTATEANIQQSGTAARTNANRDFLEGMLTDLAQYTAEQALQAFSIQEVQRIAGPQAFWPANMSIEDLFTLVEVDIEAGTTGKPKAPSDQQAWATILPLIRELIGQIEQAFAQGNMPMANALIELIKETMVRMGDDTDADRFIPKAPPPGSPGAGAPPPPIVPQVNISLKGEVDPLTAAELASPALQRDGITPPPAPPGGPGPSLSPSGPGLPPGGAVQAPKAPGPTAPTMTPHLGP